MWRDLYHIIRSIHLEISVFRLAWYNIILVDGDTLCLLSVLIVLLQINHFYFVVMCRYMCTLRIVGWMEIRRCMYSPHRQRKDR